MADELEMGYQSALYINTGTYETPVWSELDIVRDVNSLDAVDKVDLTTRGTARLGYKASGYGLREKGWSADSLVPAAGETNLAYDALITAQNAREPWMSCTWKAGSSPQMGFLQHAQSVVCLAGRRQNPWAAKRQAEPLNCPSSRTAIRAFQ